MLKTSLLRTTLCAALLIGSTVSLMACGGSNPAEVKAESTAPTKLTVNVRNASGQPIERVYISGLDSTLSFGGIATGSTDTLSIKPDGLPKSITVQWQTQLGTKHHTKLSLSGNPSTLRVTISGSGKARLG